MALPRHPQVAEWLADLDDHARAEVDEALVYLEEHGTAAALPAYRVLVGFGPDDVPALLLAGNKAGTGNSWYKTNVPVADERFDTYLSALAKSKEKPK